MKNQPMHVVLSPGQSLKVTLSETDGEFVLEWGSQVLSVYSDMPDTKGRQGVIYAEEFGKGKSRKLQREIANGEEKEAKR